MSEPDYKEDLYFEPVTLEGGLEKIMRYLEDIETCIENLPDGQVKRNLEYSYNSNVNPFKTRVDVWKKICKEITK